MFRRFVNLLFLLFLFSVPGYSQQVVLVKIDGTINPAAATFIERGIKSSVEKNAECLIVQLNTPGGLLESTRIIVGAFLESKVPIVVFVAPPEPVQVRPECSLQWRLISLQWHRERI